MEILWRAEQGQRPAPWFRVISPDCFQKRRLNLQVIKFRGRVGDGLLMLAVALFKFPGPTVLRPFDEVLWPLAAQFCNLYQCLVTAVERGAYWQWCVQHGQHGDLLAHGAQLMCHLISRDAATGVSSQKVGPLWLAQADFAQVICCGGFYI